MKRRSLARAGASGRAVRAGGGDWCSRRAAWLTAPLFQVMFAWQNTPQGELQLPGLNGIECGAGQ